MSLIDENIRLKSQLKTARSWIKKEVSEKQESISYVAHLVWENVSFHEEEAREKIQQYFPPEVYLFLSDEEISCLISSELIYTKILEGELLDGMNVVLWYHKVLDALIEQYITEWFRKFVWKRKLPDSHDPLESFFEQVHEKNYSLSFGRLFQILERIWEKKEIFWYQKFFYEYISSNSYLKKSLLESDFFVQCKQLVEGEYVGEKRHGGFLWKEETIFARNLYIGKLQNKKSLLGYIALSQSSDL